MKPESSRCKCAHCNRLFVPDHRNRQRQKYCSLSECQKARKRANQKHWLSQPENADYFRDEKNVERVRQWRQAHPGYWKRPAPQAASTLQVACPAQEVDSLKIAPEAPSGTLQDVCQVQVPLLVGLISQFTDSALQDDIVLYARHLISKGQDILDQPSRKLTKGNLVYDDQQKTPAPRAPAARAAPV